jgi:hypothetical protein
LLLLRTGLFPALGSIILRKCVNPTTKRLPYKPPYPHPFYLGFISFHLFSYERSKRDHEFSYGLSNLSEQPYSLEVKFGLGVTLQPMRMQTFPVLEHYRKPLLEFALRISMTAVPNHNNPTISNLIIDTDTHTGTATKHTDTSTATTKYCTNTITEKATEAYINHLHQSLAYSHQPYLRSDNRCDSVSTAELVADSVSKKPEASTRKRTINIATEEDIQTKKKSKKACINQRHHSLRFACPYFKHNSAVVGNRGACSGPGWESVHRLK